MRYLTWAYDPLGRPISETSPLFYKCSGVADPDGGANFSPDCGEVIVARVFTIAMYLFTAKCPKAAPMSLVPSSK
jgi:hypothetical protein